MTTEEPLGESSQRSVHGRKGNRKRRTRPTFFCQVVFAAVGLLMLTAAVLKAHEAYAHPLAAADLSKALVLVCFESLLGIWLLFGIKSAWTLRVAAMSFAAFACVSAYKSLAGASSCGCFGTLQVDPAITLVVDMAAVALLFFCRKGVEPFGRANMQRVFPTVAAIAAVVSVTATSLPLYRQIQFAQSTDTMAVGDLVVLNPESWAGKRWPLLSEAGLPRGLASGEWDVLLFRHDCHVCHDVMRELESVLSSRSERYRIALIGVDEATDDRQTGRLQNLGCLLSHLPQDRKWFATTPLRVRLRDGVCVSAFVVDEWE